MPNGPSDQRVEPPHANNLNGQGNPEWSSSRRRLAHQSSVVDSQNYLNNALFAAQRGTPCRPISGAGIPSWFRYHQGWFHLALSAFWLQQHRGYLHVLTLWRLMGHKTARLRCLFAPKYRYVHLAKISLLLTLHWLAENSYSDLLHTAALLWHDPLVDADNNLAPLFRQPQ